MSDPFSALPWSKGGYYYAYLSSHEQECYQLIYGRLIEDEFDVVLPRRLSSEEITRIINALKYDKPELFWVDFHHTHVEVGHSTVLRFEAFYSGAALERCKKTTLNRIESILTRSKQAVGTTDRERICWLHDVIAAETTYGSSGASSSHDIRGAASGTSVCEGIALWFSALVTGSGIPNRVVLADCRNAGRLNHAFNQVWLPDECYAALCIDVTADLRRDSLAAPSRRHIAPSDAAIWQEQGYAPLPPNQIPRVFSFQKRTCKEG